MTVKKQSTTRVPAPRPCVHRRTAPTLSKPAGDLMSLRQASDEFALSIATLRAWVWQRRIESIRLGRAVRIRRSAIDKLIESGTTPADPRVAV